MLSLCCQRTVSLISQFAQIKELLQRLFRVQWFHNVYKRVAHGYLRTLVSLKHKRKIKDIFITPFLHTKYVPQSHNVSVPCTRPVPDKKVQHSLCQSCPFPYKSSCNKFSEIKGLQEDKSIVKNRDTLHGFKRKFNVCIILFFMLLIDSSLSLCDPRTTMMMWCHFLNGISLKQTDRHSHSKLKTIQPKQKTQQFHLSQKVLQTKITNPDCQETQGTLLISERFIMVTTK